MPRIHMKNIAEKAGVSVTTVSRVLNGHAARNRISRETETRVLDAARSLGYNPYRSIRTGKTLQTRTIGLVIPDISHFFLSDLARSIALQAEKAGYAVLIFDSMEDTEKEIEAIERLLAYQVDGLIVLPVGKQERHLESLYRGGVNLVAVDRISPDLHCPRVSIDNYGAAYEAVSYFIEMGHRDIACIQRLPEAWINSERVRAFKDAFRAYGFEPDESLILGEKFGQKNGYLEIKLLLNRRKRPTAVFALSHLIANGALRGISEEGLRIPEDISFISFDDFPFPENIKYEVTTIRQPTSEMGAIAVNLLIEQIHSDERGVPVDIQVPTSFIRRNSVKRLNGDPTLTPKQAPVSRPRVSSG